jgi:hypothetical protein
MAYPSAANRKVPVKPNGTFHFDTDRVALLVRSNSKRMDLVGSHWIFWIFISSGGMVKVVRDSRKTVQDGKTT